MIQEIKDFEIYSNGLGFCSVCSSLTQEETIRRVNVENTTGINSNWKILEEKFNSGEPSPCPCNLYPKTHKHYLFSC